MEGDRRGDGGAGRQGAPRERHEDAEGGERDAGSVGTRFKATDKLTFDFGYRAIRETVGAYYTWATNSGYGNLGGLSGGYATGAGGGSCGAEARWSRLPSSP